MGLLLAELLRREQQARRRDYPRRWVDDFPYDSRWYEPEPQRGRPYDGAIINKDGELVIPKQS